MKRKMKREGLTSVQIRPAIARMLEVFLKRGVSKSEVINEALRQYLIEQEFQEIRSKLVPLAQAKGIYTDEDVENFFKDS